MTDFKENLWESSDFLVAVSTFKLEFRHLANFKRCFQKVYFEAIIFSIMKMKSILLASYVTSKKNLVCVAYCLFLVITPLLRNFTVEIWFVSMNSEKCLKHFMPKVMLIGTVLTFVNVGALRISQHLLCPFSLYVFAISTKFRFQQGTFFNLLYVVHIF